MPQAKKPLVHRQFQISCRRVAFALDALPASNHGVRITDAAQTDPVCFARNARQRVVSVTLKQEIRMPKRPVLVTTEYGGVFFGYADDTSRDTIVLKNARNIVYWEPAGKGFLGLAVTGPNYKCRVGPPATSIELRKISCVAECTPEAVSAWERAPWTS
jgi:hypothetical protein